METPNSTNKNILIILSSALILIILGFYYFTYKSPDIPITNKELLNLKSEVNNYEQSQEYCKYLIKEYYTFLQVFNTNQNELSTITESEEYLSAFKKFIVMNNDWFLKRVSDYDQEPNPLPTDLKNLKTKYIELINDNTTYYKKTSEMIEAGQITKDLPNNDVILMIKSYGYSQILDSTGTYLTNLSVRLMKKYKIKPEIE